MPFTPSPERQDASAELSRGRPRYSLVIPVYRNEENVPDLIEALLGLEQRLSGLEVVFVVDGSPDRSAEALSQALENVPFAWQLVELSRNFGSFAAIRQGLVLAQAPLSAVMAADLQEPPELIEEFFRILATGSYDLAVGVRAGRDDPPLTKLSSSIYWSLYRRLVMRTVPSGGVDIFACNARFREALLSLEERNSFLIGQLFWLGFRRIEVPYRRRPRRLGKSAWKLRSRLRYMLDSVFAFSDLPISILLWLGAIGSGVSVGFSILILFAWFFGFVEVRGYVPTMLAIMFFGSLMVLGQGIIGCYVWRVAENTKKRPLSLILSHRMRQTTADRSKAVSS
jgi:glycosyltransferase involved in cell wall biosynthesis